MIRISVKEYKPYTKQLVYPLFAFLCGITTFDID